MLLASWVGGALVAQNAPPLPRSGTGTGGTAGARPPAQPAKPLPPPLKENISLTIKSDIVEGFPVNMTLTGCGPEFSSSCLIVPANGGDNSSPVLAEVRLVVSQADEGYKVDCNLTYRIPVTQTSGEAQTTGYRSKSIQTTVTPKVGTPLNLASEEGRTALLTITKPAAK